MAVDTMRLGKSEIVNSALKSMEANLHAEKMTTRDAVAQTCRTLFTFTRFCASTETSATLAK